MNQQLSKNFTLLELTQTSHEDLQQQNIQKALEQPVYGNLERLATEVLQPVRDALGSPIGVNSGFRCPALNARINGSKTSQHLKGEAADITLGSPEKNKALFALIVQLMKAGKIRVGQVILEQPKGSSWIHVSLGFPNRPKAKEGQVMTYDGRTYKLIETVKYPTEQEK